MTKASIDNQELHDFIKEQRAKEQEKKFQEYIQKKEENAAWIGLLIGIIFGAILGIGMYICCA